MTVSLTWATIVTVLVSRSTWPIIFFITDRESLKAERYSEKTLPSEILSLPVPIAARLEETYQNLASGYPKTGTEPRIESGLSVRLHEIRNQPQGFG
ncbi:MAG TPA: hypothetical protein VLB46_20595 [Pyrinomonadaceae bacterium]|nr:hypothetical protein [Pyrinomonadaceae bacterium]